MCRVGLCLAGARVFPTDFLVGTLAQSTRSRQVQSVTKRVSVTQIRCDAWLVRIFPESRRSPNAFVAPRRVAVNASGKSSGSVTIRMARPPPAAALDENGVANVMGSARRAKSSSAVRKPGLVCYSTRRRVPSPLPCLPSHEWKKGERTNKSDACINHRLRKFPVFCEKAVAGMYCIRV